MKKLGLASFLVLSLYFVCAVGLCFLSSSCQTVTQVSNFSLEPQTTKKVSTTGIITGTAQYGSVYLPSATDMLEISLVGIDSEGYEVELSHQSIRNFPRFPVNFTVRYDNAEAAMCSSFRLDVMLVTGNQERMSSSSFSVLDASERVSLLI